MKCVGIAIPALLLLGGVAAAQQPCGAGAGPGAGMRHGMMMGQAGGMGGMGRMDETMMARMDSLDARLDSLQQRMNKASGSRKVNAVADLLNALVDQHREMHRMMRQATGTDAMPGMGHQMGAGPMQHGATGMMPCMPGGQTPADSGSPARPRSP